MPPSEAQLDFPTIFACGRDGWAATDPDAPGGDLSPLFELILADGAEHPVAAVPVPRVVDTTGAGDLYAAGFLYGLTRDLPLPTCGGIGSLCAAEIISHVGARPETSLARLVTEAGLA